MDYPVVFIPGLFGSLGDDVIKGTGKFSFGFAEKVYRPFIKILNSMGYVEGVNLFISHYDWKRPVLESIGSYLYPDIEKAKQKSGSERVILIGHSLGGLLGRGYLKYFIPSNVDKLIMIATPNLGAANAYYFWSGGRLPYTRIEDNILYSGLKFGFILYAHIFHNLNYLEAWRRVFPIGRDLLPSYGYGNYLFWKENGIRREVAIDKMSIRNSFLNELGNETEDRDKLFMVSGKDVFTNKEFEIKPQDRGGKRWLDGKPIRAYRTNYGDGTVTTDSALGGLDGNSIVIEGNHIDILYKSKDYLSAILNKSIVEDVDLEKIERIELIFTRNCQGINIKTFKDNEIGDAHMDIVDSRVQAIDLGGRDFWIMVAGDKDLEINVEVESDNKNEAIIYRRAIELE